MNCVQIQNTILGLPDPRQVPDSLRVHLNACPECLRWWKHAVRLERLLEHLPAPAPPAGKKAELIEQLTSVGPIIKSIPASAHGANPARNWSPRRVAAIVAGLAAAVLVAVGIGQIFRTTPTNQQPEASAPAPRSPFLEKLVRRDVVLAQERDPDKRLELLGGMAEEVAAETRSLARVATPDDLNELADLFVEVVGDTLVKRAETISRMDNLTADKKRDLFTRLEGQLAGVEREVDRVARESPPGAQGPLMKIRTTAGEGQRTLRELARKQGA